MSDLRDEPPIDADYRDPEEDGCPHFRDPAECEECWREADNDAEITSLIAKADDALVQALKGARQARAAFEELISSRVYDIELAEGAEGRDAVDELDHAARSLRHAHLILAARKRLLED